MYIMPPKKDKVKKSVESKSKKDGAKTKQGVKININIDQSKRTRSLPKAPVARRMLPAYSSAPQGASYLGAHYPNVQPNTFQQSTSSAPNPADIGKAVFNSILDEAKKRERLAYGFGGFETAGQQANNLFEGQYRAGRNFQPIILEPTTETENAVDEAITLPPTSNNILTPSSFENKAPSLPSTNENSLVGLNADERRDNDLDNLVLHESKSATEKKVDKALNEVAGEDDEEEYLLEPIVNKAEQNTKALEVQLESEEAGFIGRNVTKKVYEKVDEEYQIAPVPNRRASIQELKDYIDELNGAFNTNYSNNFKGKGAREDLLRTIRVAILKAHDNI